MGSVVLNVPYVRRKASGLYWEPSRRLIRLGFKPEALGKDEVRALQRAQELNARADQEIARPPQEDRIKKGTINWVIRECFLKSGQWAKLAPKTRKGYRRALDKIEQWAGDMPAKAVTRVSIKAWQRAMEAGSKQVAAATLRVLRIVMEAARDEGLIDVNPARKLKLTAPNERDRIWSDDEVEKFVAKARELGRSSIAFAVMLGLGLGQREGDILRLAWSQFDPVRNVVQLRQRKTKVTIAVPVLPELRTWLDTMPRLGPLMVVSEGRAIAYGEDHFRHLFAKIREAAGLDPDLRFMDLRRTAATRLGQAGCTDDMIRAITGHLSREVVRRYVRADDTMARAAIDRLTQNRISTATENASADRRKTTETI